MQYYEYYCVLYHCFAGRFSPTLVNANHFHAKIVGRRSESAQKRIRLQARLAGLGRGTVGSVETIGSHLHWTVLWSTGRRIGTVLNRRTREERTVEYRKVPTRNLPRAKFVLVLVLREFSGC